MNLTAMRHTVAIALVGAISSSVHAQPTADAAYDRVVRAWSALSTLEAQFQQQVTNPLLGRTALSRGVFLQQRPTRVAVTFTDPVGDRIVDDGSSLWVYLPSSAPGQVLKLPSNSDGSLVVDLLGQLLNAPKRTFAITGGEAVTIEGRVTRRVVLMPRPDANVPFQKATLWLEENEPRPVRVQVVDGQGVERTITLTTWQPNAVLPKNAFVFVMPKGVKVLRKIPAA